MNEKQRVAIYADFLKGFLSQSLKYNKRNPTEPNKQKSARGRKPSNTEKKEQKKRETKA
jgi:hypothetical protein